MKRMQLIFPAIVIAGALVGCSLGGTTAAGTATPAAPPVIQAPQQGPTAPANPPPQATLAQTALNPCDLVPQDEASALANFQFAEGKLEANPGEMPRCVYGSETTNVMYVYAGQAPDVATAQKLRDQFLAYLQSQAAQLAGQGLVINQIPDFADGAESGTLNISIAGFTVNGTAFGFLHNTVFVGISDVTRGQPAPTVDAMKGEANTVISRLP